MNDLDFLDDAFKDLVIPLEKLVSICLETELFLLEEAQYNVWFVMKTTYDKRLEWNRLSDEDRWSCYIFEQVLNILNKVKKLDNIPYDLDSIFDAIRKAIYEVSFNEDHQFDIDKFKLGMPEEILRDERFNLILVHFNEAAQYFVRKFLIVGPVNSNKKD